ncbi:DUF3592 domain-containing protein [Streptomyces chrestomyceticus]|uniref:DUF3592 domain-containing protein n=1 Tax=Streptomyces chrestomyceticus TaxID=68185 RepID=UPI0036B77370
MRIRGVPEVVLRGRGVVFRLEGYAVRVVRGRVTWTVPLAAIDCVEYAGGRVRLQLSGGAAQEGTFALSTRNGTAAEAFVRHLRAALARAAPSSQQTPTQVVGEVAGRRLLRLPRLSAGAKIGLGIVPYLAFSGVAAQRADELGWGTFVTVIIVYCPAGWLMLHLGWTEVVRDALVLRRRGITVSGRIREYAPHRNSETDTEWRPVYTFRTVEGERLVVTQPTGHSRRGATGPVDVTYDPLLPTRVRNGHDRRLMLRGIVLASLGVLSVVLMLIPLGFFVSALWAD